jgi:hypothetical protein
MPILYWAARLDQLRPMDRGLFEVALRLEEGDLPWIHQAGFAEFAPAAPADHRVISILAEEGGETNVESEPPDRAAPRAARGAATGAAGRASERRPAADAATAEAGTPVRVLSPRSYANVGAVMDEDRWELGTHFPQFSPPVFDKELNAFFREGEVRPLAWYPARFVVRMYYDPCPRALPILRILPEPPSNTPHLFRVGLNGRTFTAVCYTFAPDATVVRGRSWDDTATEVLRQLVVWLLRYLVWRRFSFYPGEDVGHDPRLLVMMVAPDQPCPYHAQNAYGRCCRPKHQAQASHLPPLPVGD